MPCAAAAGPAAVAPAVAPAVTPAGARAVTPAGARAVLPGTAESAPVPTDFRIGDERVSESSGLALSVRHPHTVWTVNDSGDRARVFAVDTRNGRTVGVHTFDAPAFDIEALAITPRGRMLVADIGDNAASRARVRVYWFDEPGLGATSGPWSSWELTYPDGPHDAESLAVDPRTGRVVIVTKDEVGGIYALPTDVPRGRSARLSRVGSAPGGATDAVFLPDGSALLVRTYLELHRLDPVTWSVQASTVLPLQPQGETLALAPDAGSLLAGSEGRRSLVHEVAVPPASSATPPPRGTATSTRARSTTAPTSRPLSVDRTELAAGLGACMGLVALAVVLTRLGRRGRR